MSRNEARPGGLARGGCLLLKDRISGQRLAEFLKACLKKTCIKLNQICVQFSQDLTLLLLIFHWRTPAYSSNLEMEYSCPGVFLLGTNRYSETFFTQLLFHNPIFISSFSLSWNLGVRLRALNWWCSSMQLLQRNKTNNSLSCASFFRWIGGKTDIRRDFITCSLVCNKATRCVVTQSFSPLTGLWGGSLRDVTTTAV